MILGLSIGLDTFQEGRARQAADMLKASVAIQAEVRRDGYAFSSNNINTSLAGVSVPIFNPEDGKTYTGKMSLSGGTLTTQGCAMGGMICKSSTWTRSN